MADAVRELTYSQAIQEALGIAMERDERVFLMGEDIGVYGGAFQVTGDLVQRFGEERVMDTPISELGGAGVAVGAALMGRRPVYEFQFSDFASLAMEQIVNQAAKMRFMLGGKASVPLVMRFPSGSGTGAAAQHSQSLEAWFAHVPGLTVDGNSFADVAEAAHAAIERARAGGGPSLIECLTYRHRGHSKSDRNRYRTKEEIESWVERDPIVLFEQDLLRHGMIEQDEVDALVKSVEQEIEDAVAFAKDSPAPDIASLTDFVYAAPVAEAAHG